MLVFIFFKFRINQKNYFLQSFSLLIVSFLVNRVFLINFIGYLCDFTLMSFVFLRTYLQVSNNVFTKVIEN